MNNQQVMIKDEEMNWEDLGQGVKRKIMAYEPSLMMVKVAFEKGSIGALHHHHHSQMTHIESGSFEVRIGDNKKVLSKGDAFYIPSNIEHGVVCLEEGVLIDVFSPMREDFVSA